MNRIYEEMFIIRPDATEEEITPIVEQLKTTVTSAGGTIDKEERWGVRKLAYRVEKRNEGYYVLMQFTAEPQTVKEVERRLRVNDAVLKYMTVRIDEKLKRIEKRKKQREKRAARKPAPVVAAPVAPTEAILPTGPVPGAPMPGTPAPAAPVRETQE
jgi:small subunit ribosomal protein S6